MRLRARSSVSSCSFPTCRAELAAPNRPRAVAPRRGSFFLVAGVCSRSTPGRRRGHRQHPQGEARVFLFVVLSAVDIASPSRCFVAAGIAPDAQCVAVVARTLYAHARQCLGHARSLPLAPASARSSVFPPRCLNLRAVRRRGVHRRQRRRLGHRRSRSGHPWLHGAAPFRSRITVRPASTCARGNPRRSCRRAPVSEDLCVVSPL